MITYSCYLLGDTVDTSIILSLLFIEYQEYNDIYIDYVDYAFQKKSNFYSSYHPYL